MTTQVRVLNEGPSRIRVTAIDPATGNPSLNYPPKELAPGELLQAHTMYVHNGSSIRIDEVQPGTPVELDSTNSGIGSDP